MNAQIVFNNKKYLFAILSISVAAIIIAYIAYSFSSDLRYKYAAYDKQKITITAINACYAQNPGVDSCPIGFRSDDGASFQIDNLSLNEAVGINKDLFVKIGKIESPSRFEITGIFSSVLNEKEILRESGIVGQDSGIAGTTFVGKIHADSIKLADNEKEN